MSRGIYATAALEKYILSVTLTSPYYILNIINSTLLLLQVARIVSFPQDVTGSYIAMDPVNVDQDFQATMKIKTLERDGLIFYSADDTQVSVRNLMYPSNLLLNLLPICKYNFGRYVFNG